MSSREIEKATASKPLRASAQPKDFNLKDRIHLFEGLSSQSNASENKNTSSNNSEQVFAGRYPKVVSPEHQRWTRMETAEDHLPPWLRTSREQALEDRNVGRSKTLGPLTRGRAVEKPPYAAKPVLDLSSARLPKTSSVASASSQPTAPALSPKPALTEASVSSDKTSSTKTSTIDKSDTPTALHEVMYIDGTPVKMRNNRKKSADCCEGRNSVSLMVSSFEKQGRETTEDQKKPSTGLAVMPTKIYNRKSADLSLLRQKETEERTRVLSDVTETKSHPPKKLVRRRSRSVSDIHLQVTHSPMSRRAPPSKPKRTYEHDIYIESKLVIAQRSKSGHENGVVNPLYALGSDEEDGSVTSKPRGLSAPEIVSGLTQDITPVEPRRRRKKLPAIPNTPPFTPPNERRGHVSRLATEATKPKQTRPVTAPPPQLEVTPPHEGSMPRSYSNEDFTLTKSSNPGIPQNVRRRQRDGSPAYAEPIVPVDIKRSSSETDLSVKSDDVEAVEDAHGYSVPGSHLWKKPEPPSPEHLKKPAGIHSRVQSWKSTRLSGPNLPCRNLIIVEHGKIRASFPGKNLSTDLPILEELMRGRKTSSEVKPEGHTYTEPGSHLDSVRHQGKLALMRRKINDAFRKPKTVYGQKDDDRISVTSEDSDGEVNDAVMKKRLTHVRAVKKRSSVYCNADKYRKIMQESKLYDYLVVVTLEFNQETRRYQPVEKSRYPQELSATQNDKLRAIPHFCFPDAFKWAPVETYQSESYSFVLTSIDGSRLYGYNRRLLPPGDKPRLPEVYCIITPVSCRLLYTQLLDEIERRRMVSKKQTERLIREAYTRHVPVPGSHISIMQMTLDDSASSVMRPLVLQRPQDSRLEHVDFDCLFSSLHIHQVIQIFASLLFERRVIMCSGKLSKLSKCSQAAAALLYPFAWQHVYIPVLPEKLIDMSCSPTPYIMGMLALCIPRLEELPIDEVLIVDLDSKDFYTVVGDEDTIIPKKLTIALERALTDIYSYTMVDTNDMEEDVAANDQESKNRAISEAFICFFVQTCGHYMNHFAAKYEGNLKFDREGFMKVVTSRSIRRFLEVFTETQMFSLFIQEKESEVEGIAQGLFETRVREWEAQCRVNANKFGAKVKKIGRAVKDISREGGKKMADTAKDVRTRVKANLDTKI